VNLQAVLVVELANTKIIRNSVNVIQVRSSFRDYVNVIQVRSRFRDSVNVIEVRSRFRDYSITFT
jgi:hypothetical protein